MIEPDILSLRYKIKARELRKSSGKVIVFLRLPNEYTTSKQIGKLIKFKRNTETSLFINGGPHAERR